DLHERRPPARLHGQGPRMKGMFSSSVPARWFYYNREEPRVRYLPEADVLVFIGDSQVTVRPFNLAEEFERAGKDYLLIPSQPQPGGKPGPPFRYQIEAKAKAGPTYTREKGPAGMTVSAGGEVNWSFPPGQTGRTPVIVSVKTSAGTEVFHTFAL